MKREAISFGLVLIVMDVFVARGIDVVAVSRVFGMVLEGILKCPF